MTSIPPTHDTDSVLDEAVPSSKFRTNYTLAIFQPYSLGRFYQSVNQRDAEIEPDIDSVRSYEMIDSGGYAMLAAINVSQSNANAVVGEYFSKTAIKSLEVFNYYQKHGINILTKIAISRENFLRHDYTEGYKILRDVDARYIIILADPDTTADFYYLSRKHSLINNKHVWIGWQNPIPISEAKNISSIYGPEANNALQGFIYITPNPSGLQSNQFQQFNKTWTKLVDISPRYQAIGKRISSVGMYDCAKTLLIGLHKDIEA
ncbi:hypothetical protein HDU76_011560 [Blyttiomyces sp. JEL0837]|nr:hypothetical protein HDU76_011560 [Blyttiomyces sp. JEL0837]